MGKVETIANLANLPEDSDHLLTLLHLGQLMNSSLDLKQVLDTAINQVVTFVGAERGFILLVDMNTSRVWGEAIHGFVKADLERTLTGENDENPAEISRTLVESVLNTRQPVLTHNAMEDPRFAERKSIQLSHVRSVMCVPLIAQGRLLGIVYLDNRVRSGAFTDRHLFLLSAFCHQAAVAIENARLYDNLRRSYEERLRLQEELSQQQVKQMALEEANRLKSDFIGYVAHELRNPLTSIRGYVQTMLADTDNTLGEELRQEFCESIEADSDRLLDMINELLDVSRLEAGHTLTLALHEVELKPLLEKLARRHRFYKYFTPQHQLVTRFAPNLPTYIEADGDKLNQIISNLLGNAIKYSPGGGEITFSAEADGDQLVLKVSDQGLGMTEEQRSRLFQQYERLEREEIKQIPGTGLGLYLVKQLVELHGGTIDCKSEPGKGSTFIVQMPMRQSAGDEDSDPA